MEITDKEWKRQLLEAKHPPRLEWIRGYLVPDAGKKPMAANLIEYQLQD